MNNSLIFFLKKIIGLNTQNRYTTENQTDSELYQDINDLGYC